MTPYLIVAADFVTTGGMDRANHALASFLARRGDEVHLVAYQAADDLLDYPNVTLHRVPKPANSYFLGEFLLDRVGRYWARKVSARDGRVIVNGGNCQWGDVNWVHYVHAAYTPQVVGSVARRLKGRVSHRVFLDHERRALRRAQLVIANSLATQHDLIEKIGISPSRIRVVYLGTDPKTFTPASPTEQTAARTALGWPQERPVVAFVGALGDRRKGFDTLFRAWRDLCQENRWDVDLAVIGAGAELPQWKSRTSQAGIASRIRYLGFRPDIRNVLVACDALVAPTRYEAYGLGVQEAWYCGLPAIFSASAGASERCPAELADLLIQNHENADELILRLKNWRANMDRYRIAALDSVPAHHRNTWEAMAEEFLAVVESGVISDRHTTTSNS